MANKEPPPEAKFVPTYLLRHEDIPVWANLSG